MNQIIFNSISKNKINIQNSNQMPDKHNKNKTSNNKWYKITFIISAILAFIFIGIFMFRLYSNNQNEKLSKLLTESYSISTLYSNDINNYEVTPTDNSPFVIGIIKIDKINLNYSILSVSNNNLLDISVCRFAGPMPNEVGNLCIAGHNYVDYKFFSRLNELSKNDKISIYDLSGNKVDYVIYDIYEAKSDDTSCTFQNTNGLRIVTLVTCNNVNGKRLVIHAKEM